MKILSNIQLRLLLSFCLIASISIVRAEEIMGKVTPQTANFIRYGDIPASLHEGKVHATIPIYEIPDKDFPFSISLNYTSDGFKPYKPSGLVGMDWSLTAGGAITREVYGAPDDHNGYIGTNSVEKGFWTAIKAGRIYDKETVYNQQNSIFQSSNNLPMINGVFHDYQPDLFQFRFGNYEGAFMISNNGNILCNQPGFKVNLNGMNTQYMGFPSQRSEIILTTPDGYKWTFGGWQEALEYSFPYQQGLQIDEAELLSPITAWHLVRIETPNGRAMNFEYEKELGSIRNSAQLLTYGTWNSSSSSTSFRASKGVFLKKITIEDSDFLMEFILDTDANPSYWWNHVDYNNGSMKLNQIKVSDGGSLLTYNLTYSITYGRKFLNSFAQEGLPAYQLNYYHVAYPNVYNAQGATDKWGYWTGNTANTGLLSRITYPAGGYTTFDYEKNLYGELVETKLISGSEFPLPDLKTENGNTGGSRIRKISHYSEDSSIASYVEYLYVKNYTPGINLNTAARSGTLFHSPYYMVTSTGSRVDLSNEVWSKNYNIEDAHIGYQEVVERYPDNSYIINRFTQYMNNPDIPDVKLTPIGSADLNSFQLVLTNVSAISSRSFARGVLSERALYNTMGEKVSCNRYDYKHINPVMFVMPAELLIPDDSLDYVVSYRPVTGGRLSRKVYLPYCPRNWEWTTGGFNEPETITSYTYNGKGLIKESKTTDSKSDSIKIHYSYTEDGMTSGVYTTMRDKNMINSMICKKTYKNNLLIHTDTYNYHQFPAGIAIKEHLISIGQSEAKIEKSYNYDNKLNVKEISSKGLTTCYIWSYGGKHPVARIEGKTAVEIENILGTGNLSTLSGNPTDQQLIDIFNALRSVSTMKDALITSYTYKPLMGISSITDPKGYTIYYDYDALGRLVKSYIKKADHTESILESYEYNYKNQ